MDLWSGPERTYTDFASYAVGESATLEAWARGVAGDPAVHAWLERLPRPKQQPNLVFAAARWHGVPDDADYPTLREALLDDDGSIVSTVLTRATQTNEAGRTATLLPALMSLPGVADGEPVALVEAGASGGLCLYPDRWAYRWRRPDGSQVLLGDVESEPVLECRAEGPVPFPDRRPVIAWRGGVDLNPLDVTDDDAARWLETLVWPEHEDRRARLRAATALARADPPHLVRGDLLEVLPGLVEQAAAHGLVVVQHSAVVAYLDDLDRARFASMMGDLVASGACHWLSNEGPQVLPGVTGDAAPPSGSFVLGVDGRAVAHTHGHGRSITWL